jgi:hypothetical protein
MKTKKYINRRARVLSAVCILAIAVMGITLNVVAGEVLEKCKNTDSCGTSQTPDISNACIGTTCPYRVFCQNPGSSANCTQWAYMACCQEYSLDLDPLGNCSGVPDPIPGECLGNYVCEACSAP